MRRALERTARGLWRGNLGLRGAILSVLLLPVSSLWWLATTLRNWRYDLGGVQRVEGIRVVSIGNLAVGGTGKTPLASWVAGQLRAAGERTSLLLRGYGTDEVALHRRWTPDLPVRVGSDRVALAREAAAESTVAVLDDGFQHRRLARDVDLVLIAVEDGVPGRVLPRGPFREPASAIRRADGIVLTRRTATYDDARRLEDVLRATGVVDEGQLTACVHLDASALVPLAEWAAGEVSVAVEGRGTRAADAGDMRQRSPLLVTAVARPEAVREQLETLVGHPVEMLAYADHHDFSARDVGEIQAMSAETGCVFTEKDAVKLTSFLGELPEARVLTQRLTWDWGEQDVLSLIGATK